MSVEVNAQMICEIVESIYSTMLDLPVQALEPAPPALTDKVTSSVYLEGSWNGGVAIQCSHTYACRIAARFLGIDPPEKVNDDVRDVLGEMANMIGGNLKSCMGTDVRLSLPSVIDGSNYEIRVCGSEGHEDLKFDSPDGEFWVRIISKEGIRSSSSHTATFSQIN